MSASDSSCSEDTIENTIRRKQNPPSPKLKDSGAQKKIIPSPIQKDDGFLMDAKPHQNENPLDKIIQIKKQKSIPHNKEDFAEDQIRSRQTNHNHASDLGKKITPLYKNNQKAKLEK